MTTINLAKLPDVETACLAHYAGWSLIVVITEKQYKLIEKALQETSNAGFINNFKIGENKLTGIYLNPNGDIVFSLNEHPTNYYLYDFEKVKLEFCLDPKHYEELEPRGGDYILGLFEDTDIEDKKVYDEKMAKVQEDYVFDDDYNIIETSLVFIESPLDKFSTNYRLEKLKAILHRPDVPYFPPFEWVEV